MKLIRFYEISVGNFTDMNEQFFPKMESFVNQSYKVNPDTSLSIMISYKTLLFKNEE